LLLAAGLVACASNAPGPFQAALHADHPWVGRVWRVDTGSPGSWPEVVERVEAARFVLLGEIHDNPDHHRLQARLLARLAGSERPPAVVFEMLDREFQERIDEFLTVGRREPDALASELDWASSGWPAFRLYRPVFRVALDAGLPLLAAGLPRSEAGAPAGPETDPRFGLAEPLPPEERASRLEELFAAHCELVPREALAPMLAVQRARDARMAAALLEGAERRGRAVLVAGLGHVEAHGVPALLRRTGVPPAEIASVGFVEVDPGVRRAEDGSLPAVERVVFTPAAEREDPCERLRRQLDAAP
jgi:uncharacterized iron-regulated protein